MDWNELTGVVRALWPGRRRVSWVWRSASLRGRPWRGGSDQKGGSKSSFASKARSRGLVSSPMCLQEGIHR